MLSGRVGRGWTSSTVVRVGALAAGVVLAGGCQPDENFDVVIRGGWVVDGTGRPPVLADVGIRGDRIVRLGDLSDAAAVENIDAEGLHVAPGFINLHSHNRLDAAPTAVNLLSQGVTTIVLNADGGGPLDLGAQLSEAQAAGLAVHVAPNIGFNSAWSEVMGPEDRRPTPDHLAAIHRLVEAGLEAGAWGVSAGLDYKPAYFARVEEVTGALSGLEGWRTLFTNHDRLTPETGFSSRVGMEETVAIGEATGLMPVFTHMKIQGREQGSAPEVLAMMDSAIARGVYTAADAYPYLAGQTSLAALIIPGWAQEGGWEAMTRRFADPALRARIVEEANEALDARFGGASGVYLPETDTELTAAMTELGAGSGGDAVVRILVREESSPTTILRFGSDDDLADILAYPTTSVGCDCDPSDTTASHPRYWGTFPRVLGRYVREQGVLTLEDAVRKMSGLPAATVGMVDRGLIAPGMKADVVVFDAGTVIDHATFAEPNLPSEGIVHVMVEGRWAFRDGEATGIQAGQGLRRSTHMPARAQDEDVRRRVVLTDTVAGDTPAQFIDVSLVQEAGEGAAEGRMIYGFDGAVQAMATRLGVLQTAPGWASITGMALVGDEERPFVLILDAADPSAEGEGTTVILEVAGLELASFRTTGVLALGG